MDDKTFVAAYVAKETQRINETLKDMINSPEAPSEETRQAIVQDIETTLERLKSALSQIHLELDESDEEEEAN